MQQFKAFTDNEIKTLINELKEELILRRNESKDIDTSELQVLKGILSSLSGEFTMLQVLELRGLVNSKKNQIRLAQCLKKIGCVKQSIRVKSKVIRVWIKP